MLAAGISNSAFQLDGFPAQDMNWNGRPTGTAISLMFNCAQCRSLIGSGTAELAPVSRRTPDASQQADMRRRSRRNDTNNILRSFDCAIWHRKRSLTEKIQCREARRRIGPPDADVNRRRQSACAVVADIDRNLGLRAALEGVLTRLIIHDDARTEPARA